jgi:hypothetical protein
VLPGCGGGDALRGAGGLWALVGVYVLIAVAVCISLVVMRARAVMEGTGTTEPEPERCWQCRVALGTQVASCYVLGRWYCMPCYQEHRDLLNAGGTPSTRLQPVRPDEVKP